MNIQGVTTTAPRVNSFAILANAACSYGAAVVGVDPARERDVSTIASMIRRAALDTTVLGASLARNLQVAVGGKLTLRGATRDGSVAADVLRVVRIYQSGLLELDRSILEMPLSRAQDTFAMISHASTIALAGTSLGADDGTGKKQAVPVHHFRAIGVVGDLDGDRSDLELVVRPREILRQGSKRCRST